MIAMLDLAKLRHLHGGHVGVRDVACPLCGPDCRSPANRRRKVLRIWDDGEFITYKCVRCEAHGWARDEQAEGARPAPKPKADQATTESRIELACFLWSQSRPLIGSLAETYLHSRQCFIASESLRFLPRKNDHSPAMIARFGSGSALTGIHLTRLRDDGLGKAGTGTDKMMIGPSVGQPIVVCDNPDHGELIIAEGIEDAASLALAMGWTAWAAGAAGRIAPLLGLAARFDRVFLAVDHDRAGTVALAQARQVRPDLIPIDIAKVLSITDRCDANRAHVRFGLDALRAAVEWSEAQAQYARREIGFHAMQASVERACAVFKAICDA